MKYVIHCLAAFIISLGPSIASGGFYMGPFVPSMVMLPPLRRILEYPEYSRQLCTLSDYHPSVYLDIYPKLLDIAYFAIIGGGPGAENAKLSYNCPFPVQMDIDSCPVWVLIPYENSYWSVVFYFCNKRLCVVIGGSACDKVSGGIFKTPLSSDALALRKIFSRLHARSNFKQALNYFDTSSNGLGSHILLAIRLAILDLSNIMFNVKPLEIVPPGRQPTMGIRLSPWSCDWVLWFGVSENDVLMGNGKEFFSVSCYENK